MTGGWGPGIHGKMPARGDFVVSDLPGELVEAWDSWLGHALAETRRVLGPVWERLFVVAPAWRFALAGGVCGPGAVAGIWAPSMDRVGRLYPLALMAALPAGVDPATVPAACVGWFDRAERHLLALRGPPAAPAGPPPAGPGRPRAAGGAFHRALVEDLVGPLGDGASLWWTRGAANVAPSLLACRGLPDGLRLAAMLDGDWSRWGWLDLEREAAGPGARGSGARGSGGVSAPG